MVGADAHVRIINYGGCSCVKGFHASSELSPEQILGSEVDGLEVCWLELSKIVENLEKGGEVYRRSRSPKMYDRHVFLSTVSATYDGGSRSIRGR